MILRALESEYAAQTGRRLEHCALRVKVRVVQCVGIGSFLHMYM